VSWRARGGGDEWRREEVVIAIVIVILSISCGIGDLIESWPDGISGWMGRRMAGMAGPA
jgi:hypothetical protein